MHSTHAELPGAAWNVLAEHLVQLPCPTCALYVPVLHAAAAVLPVLQYVPASQLAHPDSADSPAAPLYRPAGHSGPADAPCGQ